MYVFIRFVLCLLISYTVCATSLKSGLITEDDQHGLSFFEPLDYDQLDLYAPVSNTVDNEICRNHSLQFLAGVRDKHLWALKMLDASTKGADGLWVGSLVQLGNYDECLSVQDVPSDAVSFSGQHCLVSLGANNLFSEIYQRNKATEEYMQNIKIRVESTAAGGVAALISKMGATVAMCIPSSCTSRDLEQHLRTELRSTNISVRVHSLACSSTVDEVELQINDWCAIALLICIGVVIVFSTAYDLRYTNPGSSVSLMTAFSVYSNGRKLLTVTSSTADNMTSLSGVRVLSIMWVVMIHTVLLAVVTPTVNVTLKESAIFELKNLYVTYGTLCVEPFFLLSGLLVCYNFMKDRDKNMTFNPLKFYMHRYLRLTPAYAVMMLLIATLVNYIGQGPWWKPNMTNSREACEKFWMFGLLYVNNYYPGEGMCMGSMAESWYLAVDMQLFFLSPFVLYPMWRYPRFGKVLLGIAVAAGLATACAVPYVNRFPFSALPGNSVSAFHQYHATHTRFTPWLLGIGLGYLLHKTKCKTPKLSRPVVIGGWILGLFLINVSFLPAYFFLRSDYVYERLSTSIFTGLSRPGFALGVAWIVFACIKGYGGKVNSFLSCAPMQVLGRLTYTVYLSHLTVLRHFYASIKTPIYGDELATIMSYVSKLILCFAVALVLHLAVEAPVLNIERVLLNDRPPVKTKKPFENNVVESYNTKPQDQQPS